MLMDVSEPGDTVRNSVLFVLAALVVGDGRPAARNSSRLHRQTQRTTLARSRDSATGTVSGAMKAE